MHACMWNEILFSSDRILSLEKLGVIFNQVATPLQYTPRKLAVHPPSGNLLILETDHNAFTEATKTHRKQQMAEVTHWAFVFILIKPLLAGGYTVLVLCPLNDYTMEFFDNGIV